MTVGEPDVIEAKFLCQYLCQTIRLGLRLRRKPLAPKAGHCPGFAACGALTKFPSSF